MIHEDIMRWLYTLSLRAPRSAVMLVANKCDGSTDKFSKTVEQVESCVERFLKDWCKARGSDDGRAVQGVTLLEETSAVSCLDFSGISKLRDRISKQGATEIKVPPAWDLALEGIEALRDGRSLLQAARSHLKCFASEGEERVIRARKKPFVTRMDLRSLWENTVASIGGEALNARQKAAMINPRGALEGALWIR